MTRQSSSNLGAHPLTKILSLVEGGILDPFRDPSRTGLDGLLFARCELEWCKLEPLRRGRSSYPKNQCTLWDRILPRRRADQMHLSAKRVQKLLGISAETMGRRIFYRVLAEPKEMSADVQRDSHRWMTYLLGHVRDVPFNPSLFS